MLPEANTYITRDSGNREEFQTGMVRDTEDGKGRFDLIPYYPLKRLAQLYERGAKKYGDNNWRKGGPLSRTLSSLRRHAMMINEDFVEDHLAAVVFNAFALMETEEGIRTGRLPEELDDLRWTTEKAKAASPPPSPPVFLSSEKTGWEEAYESAQKVTGKGCPQCSFVVCRCHD